MDCLMWRDRPLEHKFTTTRETLGKALRATAVETSLSSFYKLNFTELFQTKKQKEASMNTALRWFLAF